MHCTLHSNVNVKYALVNSPLIHLHLLNSNDLCKKKKKENFQSHNYHTALFRCEAF